MFRETENLTSHKAIESSDPPKITASYVEDYIRYVYSYENPKLIRKENLHIRKPK